jgi:hypothetical protein
VQEGLHHEAGADEEKEGQRDLGDDQRAAQAAGRRAIAGAGFELVGEVLARGRQRRGQAEDHAGEDRDEGGEEEDATSSARRTVARCPPERRCRGGRSSRGPRPARGRAGGGEEDALGEELPDDAAAARAEGDADGDLAPARGGAREQQVGDVGAGDEQHAADGSEEDVDRRAHVADDLVAERDQDDADGRVGVGVVALERAAMAVMSPRARSIDTSGRRRPTTWR